MRQIIRLNESELKRMISESIRRVLYGNTYTDANGDEWDETYIERKIETLIEDYYGYRTMSKRDVIETLQWLKSMDAVSLISKVVDYKMRRCSRLSYWYDSCKRDLLKLYNSL